LHFLAALTLLPVAAIGHLLGLKAHNAIMRNDLLFKRWIGGGLVIVSGLGLWGLRQAMIDAAGDVWVIMSPG
jgi:protein-S-isoprenylcysteine O-methyltransferase Ste14